ncbi:MAG: NAD/FAD-dependent oxidoreductase [Sandaracinus sp.]|nr:NAD/FAD-dependent oxidoreductase [Sandaracinus sp.]|tara:strand:+ start:1134 stop:2057 length:924 start_codon:yes stop_codon:yes gene_type:complete
MTDERIAIVGAGMAGLACAERLVRGGRQVVLFDKGRRVGGRMATRRQAGRQFDHGAQFFTARDPSFQEAVRGWQALGVVGEWAQAGEDAETRWVGSGSNRALPEHLAASLDVRLGTAIAPLDGRTIHTEEGRWLGRFDEVVVTAPPTQAAALLACSDTLLARLGNPTHSPCWAVIAAFAERPCEEDVLRDRGALQWIARDASKPGRPKGETWVIHANEAWSRANLEHGPERVADELLRCWAHSLGRPMRPTFAVAHRWRYARVTDPIGEPFLRDPEARLTLAGDGLLGPRVEAAWLSGVAAAEAILG